jgi:rare lipoprotein A (peptidoglycan hydrolase)
MASMCVKVLPRLSPTFTAAAIQFPLGDDRTMMKDQIVRHNGWALFTGCAVAIGTMAMFSTTSQAQTRSGRAAYHLHTGQMVTAARHEPRGSVLKVTNPETGRTVTVTVNDRGPFNGNRILDLSTGAFRHLYGGLGRGVGPVQYEVVSRPLASRGGRRTSGSSYKSKKSSRRYKKRYRSSSVRRSRRSSR